MESNFNLNTYAIQNGQRADTKRPRSFAAKNEWFFWVYVFGYLAHRLLSGDFGAGELVALMNLVEVAAFIVGFSRARHNWLVVWNYALISSLFVTWIGYAAGQIFWINAFSGLVSVIWAGTVAALVFGFVGFSRRLGLDPWKFSKASDSW